MRTVLVALSALAFGASLAICQTSDSLLAPGAVSIPGAPLASGLGDLRDLKHQCWLNCRTSFGRASPSQVQGARALQEAMEQLAHASPPPSARRRVAVPAAERVMRGGRGAATLPAGPDDSSSGTATSGAEVGRYLIEEWRRAELDVADSVHHVFLDRIFATFDSTQRSAAEPEARARLLEQLDLLNGMNQLAWVRMRAEVNRRADSAEGAPPPPP